jgi:hypothetical protein
MSFEWSFSGERSFNRCQRQYFIREFVASHSAKDPLRREYFVLKQLKTLDEWHGLLIHSGIEKMVVPLLSSNGRPNWDEVIARVTKLAERQREFSRAQRYRDATLSKSKAGDDYCALLCHDNGRDLTPEEWDATVGVVELAFRNLAGLDALWEAIERKGRYSPELHMHLTYDGAHIVVKPDLVCFPGAGEPIIVDWKVSESMGGSDARTQMGVYAWALNRSSPGRVKSVEDVALLEVQLLKPAVFLHRCDEDVLIEIENRVFRSIDEIRSLCGDGNYKTLDQMDFELAQNANTCALCPFRKYCSASLITSTPQPEILPRPKSAAQKSLFDFEEADEIAIL